MPDQNHCPQCGTPLPFGALAGLCPACLLKMGAAADTVTDAKQKAFVPPDVSELAAKFPQLEILELVGKGGMGAVYKARQKQLDRIVALKILPPGIGDEPAFAERFTREAKALAKLNHPNIVTLYEFGDASGQFYFLMEFVDGVNLRQLLAGSRIAPREALAIVPQICDALQFAHDQGIVHRDIKPENILLDRRGRVKVADFGLAKIISNDAPLTPSLSSSDGKRVAKPGEGSPVLTDAGKVMGTPQYMSPEQIQAPGEVDHRADIYALGVVFYQMLTGELPGKQFEAPSKKVSIDVRLDEIVLRALEKKPELRYQQVSDVKTMVESLGIEAGKKADAARNSKGWLSKFVPFGTPIPATRLTRVLVFCLRIWAIVGVFLLYYGWKDGAAWKIWMSILPFLATGILVDALVGVRKERNGDTDGEHAAQSSPRWIGTGVVMLIFVLTFLFSNKHYSTPAMKLSQSEFLGEFQSNAIAHATIKFDGQNSQLATISGTCFKTDKDGKVTKEAVPFVTPNVLLTQKTLDELLVSDKVEASTANTMWTNLAWGVAPFLILGVGFLFILGIIIYLVWRAVNITPKVDALPAIEAWLALMDKGDYAGTWQTASPGFRMLVSEAEWVGKCIKVRKPLGNVFARELKTSGCTVFGRIFKAQFATRFAGGFDAVETVQFSRQVDGSWKAITYIVRTGTDLARDWKRAFWIVFISFVFITIILTAVNIGVGMLSIHKPSSSAKSTGGRVIKGPPFVAHLNEAEVELVAVGDQPWTNTFCWRPDGQPCAEAFPIDNGSMDSWVEGKVTKKIAFRIRNESPTGMSCPVCRDDAAADVLMEGTSLRPAWRRQPKTEFIQMVACPTNATSMNIVFGLANGAWETAATLDHHNNMSGAEALGDWSANWNAIVGRDEVAINCNYSKNKDWETRMVGIDDGGQTILITENSSHTSTLSTGGILLVSSNEFAHIKEFQLQRRKYQLVEFRNVALQPGYRTAVMVIDTDPVGKKEIKLSPLSAVQDWLALADAGAYSQTWDAAAASFRADGQKDAWIKLLEKVRQPLGQVISRKVISAQTSDVVTEMPVGSYYVVQFATSFAALTNAVETVEFMQESDGQWRAISYLIRPRTAEQTAAVAAAQKWLAEIDAGNYSTSWTDAAEYFQGAITQDKWVEALQAVRKPLGDLKIRTVDSAVTETQMPGAPDGRYVVMQFETAFANKNLATETVTFLLEADGTWKACGYYIK